MIYSIKQRKERWDFIYS